MPSLLSRLVRRWGARAVGLVLTAIGLYVVFPGLLTLFGSWPRLRDVSFWWFAVVVVLVFCSMACLWWLTRLALQHRVDEGPWSTVGWGTAASAHLAGNAAGKVVPGGPATAGLVQARVLIQSGQSASAVASAITAVGLLTTGMLLMLPVLTIPALLIGPPPARQLGLGLVTSLVVAIVMVLLATAMVWTPFVVTIGRLSGRVLHIVRRRVTADSAATTLVAARDRIAASFAGRRTRAVVAAAGNRMFDFAALVAALAALGAHARPSEVLMAYSIAQALALIPITPGGLGFVESGLTTLLVLIGVTADQAVVATLFYRLIAYWMPIPLGAIAWAGWRLNLHLTGDNAP